jgi:hypothetical protein
MMWLAWRQVRTPAVVVAAAVAATVALLLLTGPRLADAFVTGGLADCAAGRETDAGTLTCGDLERRFLGSYPQLKFAGAVLVAMPALVGAFWGAPLVARELESGTYRLAWAQSVTRSRWLAVKLAVAGLLATAVTAALSLAYTWWAVPLDRLDSRIAPGTFAQRGIVPIAYALFAVMLGVAAGAVIRRTVPAMAVAVGGFVAVRLAVQAWARPWLADPEVLRYPTFTFFGDEPPGRVAADNGWVLASHTVDGTGRVVSSGGTIRDDVAAEMCRLGTDVPSKEQLDACGQQLGLHDVVRFVPGDRFWALQLREAALLLALAVAVGAFSFWWVSRRAIG